MFLNTMTFIEFLKAILVVVWIIFGFIIFFKEINAEDLEEVESIQASTHTTNTVVVEKTTVIHQTVSASLPVPTVVSDDKALDVESDINAMKDVVFFSGKLRTNKRFYESLNDDLKSEFKKLFIDQGPAHLANDLNYTIGQENPEFFAKVYQNIYDYRRVISLPLMKRLHQELVSYAPDAKTKTLLNQTAATTTYTRRKDEGFLDYTQTLCADDVALHQKKLNTKNGYVYSYVRQAIILEKAGKFNEALAVVQDAINRGLDDRTKGNYAERKARLEGLIKDAKAKEASAKAALDKAAKDKAAKALLDAETSKRAALEAKEAQDKENKAREAKAQADLEASKRANLEASAQAKVEADAAAHALLAKNKELEAKQAVLASVDAVELPPVSANDSEDDGDANVMKDVIFFKKSIKVNPYFYEKLNPALQPEFKKLFVDASKDHLVPSLNYKIGEANEPFFKQVFQSIFEYRKTISLPLLEVLLKELLTLTDDKESQSLMYQTAARTSYPRRKDAGFLDFCERCATSDISLHQKNFNSKNKYVYSFVRQAIILEKSDRIQDALTLVDDALSRQLDDRTKGNFTERRVRLLGLKEALDVKNKVKEEPEEAEEESSSAADEAALENIQIFKTAIKAKSDFYERLTDVEKTEFRSYFMDEGPNRLTKDIVYTLNGNNDMFFTKVFNYIYRYRKLITLSLLNKIYQELLSFTNSDAETQTIINELAIRVAYFRRKDPAYLEVSYQWSTQDVKLHRTTLDSKNKFVYSFTRLAIILEKKKLFKDAIELVNDAMIRGLNDKTKTGYNGRLVRLNKKLGAQK